MSGLSAGKAGPRIMIGCENFAAQDGRLFQIRDAENLHLLRQRLGHTHHTVPVSVRFDDGEHFHVRAESLAHHSSRCGATLFDRFQPNIGNVSEFIDGSQLHEMFSATVICGLPKINRFKGLGIGHLTDPDREPTPPISRRKDMPAWHWGNRGNGSEA